MTKKARGENLVLSILRLRKMDNDHTYMPSIARLNQKNKRGGLQVQSV